MRLIALVTSAVGFVVGFALFGALTYPPLFQQVVRGRGPTSSGLQLLPVMAGLLASSIASRQLISRTGRYKALTTYQLFAPIAVGASEADPGAS